MILGSISGGSNKTTEIDSRSIKFGCLDVLDSFTKLAVLAIFSGYQACDRIFVNGKFAETVDVKKLGNFISYNLNHDVAPRRFSTQISFNRDFDNPVDVGENDYQGILSFSGGIDSTAGLLYALERKMNVVPMWIDFGQRNKKAEEAAVRWVLARLKIEPIIVRLDLEKIILDGWRQWNFIVPGRNFLFLSIANAILQRSRKRDNFILLCAHKDEMGHKKNRDKSLFFFEAASGFFSAAGEKKIAAFTPFKDFSKTEILSYWKKEWEKKFNVSPHDTTTCYYENGCGECEACLKRSIYLTAAGYPLDPAIRVNPMTDPSGFMRTKWIPRIKGKNLSRTNELDFLLAIEKHADSVPKEVSNYLLKLPWQTRAALERRKREIDSIKI